MKAIGINLIRFDHKQIVILSCSYMDHHFNNNDNHKINYLSSSMPKGDQVVYSPILNVVLAQSKFEPSCKHWMSLLQVC